MVETQSSICAAGLWIFIGLMVTVLLASKKSNPDEQKDLKDFFFWPIIVIIVILVIWATTQNPANPVSSGSIKFLSLLCGAPILLGLVLAFLFEIVTK